MVGVYIWHFHRRTTAPFHTGVDILLLRVGKDLEATAEDHSSAEEPKPKNPPTESSSADMENGIGDPLLEETRGKGGIKAIPTILAIEAVEEIASYGLPPNMILYLTKDYHLEVVKANTILYIWSSATSFFPLVGALISDSYLGRFLTITIGSIFSLLGLITLWMTSILPGARPSPCSSQYTSCSSATGFQMFILCASFALVSIGTGGIRSSCLAFGADQLRGKGEVKSNSRAMEHYFSVYYGLVALSIFIAFTGIVYIQAKLGWKVGFGVPAVLMFVAALAFLLASPLYIKLKVKSTLIVGLLQAIVVSFKRRNLELPSESTNTTFHCRRDSLLLKPSENLRCLNKACVIMDPDQELTTDGTAKNPWSLCTTDQVEELKMLIRVIPLWSTGILMFMCLNQTSITVLQAQTMHRKFGSLNIPPASFATFQLVVVVLWIFLYQRVILRVASKVMGKPVTLPAKRKMGLGLFASFLGMIAAAIMETVRRRRAISQGVADKPNAVIDMSAFWLLPQLAFIGIAEAANAIGQNHFYCSEFPTSMSSIAASLLLLGISISNLLASLVMNIINDITSKGGKHSWISSNINEGHYDYYYWFLSGLALVNVIYYLICSKHYGLSKEEMNQISEDQGNVLPRI
ncbi:hypothetical protein M9H77_19060 [Catharanthus roseus]|uniref:Uncharacterized protein n=1 Tax=Catharanthus roseus TaxID=4058 RepID=A0ACC0B9C4_CATRO|nr:hypothetical protein M9H77_19060 [Catharanthus roseus]